MVKKTKSIYDVKPKDHICIIYETKKEHKEIITKFVNIGFKENQKIIYIADKYSIEDIKNYFDKTKINNAIKKGQFQIFSSRDVYLKNKAFNPDRMIKLLISETEKALNAGYSALRVTGEMTWILKDFPGSDMLIEYESKLNTFFPKYKCLAICQYHKPSFDAKTLQNIIMTHPYIIIGTKFYKNFYYIPPPFFFSKQRGTEILNTWIKNLEDYNIQGWSLLEIEGSLKIERQFSENIINTSQAIILILDKKGEILFYNKYLEKLSGYKLKEMRGKDWFSSFLPEKDWPVIKKLFKKAVDNIQTRGNINPIVKRNGELKYIEWYDKTLKDENDNTKGLLCIGLDITERRNTYLQLKESEEKYRTLFEKCKDSIFIIDPITNKIIDANNSLLKIFGYSKSEILKLPLKKLFPEITTPGSIERRQRLKNKKDLPLFETCIKTKKGKYIDIELSINNIYNCFGKDHVIQARFRDITRRKEAERKLRESEHNFRILFNSVSDPLFLHNYKGDIIEVNNAACRSLGYSREELINLNVKDIEIGFNNKDLRKIWNEMDKKTLTLTGKHRKKDGSNFPVEVHLGAFEYREKKHMLASARNISERIKTEKKMRESEEKYRNLYNESKIKALEKSRLLAASKAILKNNEFPITVRKIFDICKELIGAQSGYIVLSDKEGKESEILFTEPGGKQHSVDGNIPMPITTLRNKVYISEKPFFNNNFIKSKWNKLLPPGHFTIKTIIFSPLNIDRKTHGIIVLANKTSDFTENDLEITEAFSELIAIALKNAKIESALIKEKDFAESILETAQMIILILDTKGKIVRFNSYMEEISGYKLDEVKGKNWFTTFLPEKDQKRIKNVFKNAISNIQTKGNINCIVTKSGEKREIIWYDKTLKDENGEIIGIIAAGQDITEQLKIEERLKQSEKMEAIGHLAGGIAHDFNNILGGIIGYSQLTLEEVPEGSYIYENIQQILKSSDRAKELVKQILSFSRQRTEIKIPIFLKPVLIEAIKLLHASIPSSIKIKSRLASETKPILADATQIHEIILNLSTNSAYAMKDKGILHITYMEKEVINNIEGVVSSIKPGLYSVITVKDDGEGMTKETLSHIFEPFFTTRKDGKGTGMGLAAVFGIVKNHKGNIIIKSSPGKGTSIQIYLPKTNRKVKKDKDLNIEVKKGNERILFIDDEKIICEMTRKILDKLGYSVTVFSDSMKALKAFKNSPESFDLIITDQTMPDLTGIELAAEVLKIKSDIPILLCTGYSNIIDENIAQKAGIKGFCMKPVKIKDIAYKIRYILEKKNL